MLVGHVAVGFAAKRLTPTTSLGTLVLGALLADLLWCLFLAVGLERLQFIARGPTLMSSVAVSEISYSHSLVTTALWGALFAAAFFVRTRDRRAAWILFGAVLSHWPLDWISHPPDMPLAPGIDRAFGLGLWRSVPATFAVEGGFWLAAVGGYVMATRPRNRAGTPALLMGVLMLTAAWYNNIAGPPPADPSSAGIASLVFFSLVCVWAYWMNRARLSRADVAPEATSAGCACP